MKTVGLTFPAHAAQETEKLACPHCGKEYKTAESLAKHIKEKHPNVPPKDDTDQD